MVEVDVRGPMVGIFAVRQQRVSGRGNCRPIIDMTLFRHQFLDLRWEVPGQCIWFGVRLAWGCECALFYHNTIPATPSI